jgi:hypothetical protein
MDNADKEKVWEAICEQRAALRTRGTEKRTVTQWIDAVVARILGFQTIAGDTSWTREEIVEVWLCMSLQGEAEARGAEQHWMKVASQLADILRPHMAKEDQPGLSDLGVPDTEPSPGPDFTKGN